MLATHEADGTVAEGWNGGQSDSYEFATDGAHIFERRASLARANDARMKLRRNPASSACAGLAFLSFFVNSFPSRLKYAAPIAVGNLINDKMTIVAVNLG